MSYTENLIRSTDFAVFMKGCRGEWIPYPDSGKIFSKNTGEFIRTQKIAGYHSISFRFTHAGQNMSTRIPLHRALWVLCNGMPLSLLAEVDHIDGNKDNNCISNLRLISNAENSSRKLSWEKAEEIRAKFRAGATKTALAEEYGVGRTTVQGVIARRTYKHPPEKMPVWRHI